MFRKLGWLGFTFAVVAFLLGPTLILVPMSFSSSRYMNFPPPGWSFRWYENFFHSVTWLDAATVSIQVATVTAIAATVLGTLAAIGLTRGNFPGRTIANAVILSPLITPIIVVAIALFSVFLNWNMTGTVLTLAAGHTVLALPFVIVNVVANLRTMDLTLELASMSLGAGPIRTFYSVTLPLLLPGVLAGALFAFIISWDEIVISIFLSSPQVRTLPVVMWGSVRFETDPTLAAVGTLLTAATTLMFLTAIAIMKSRRLTSSES